MSYDNHCVTRVIVINVRIIVVGVKMMHARCVISTKTIRNDSCRPLATAVSVTKSHDHVQDYEEHDKGAENTNDQSHKNADSKT